MNLCMPDKMRSRVGGIGLRLGIGLVGMETGAGLDAEDVTEFIDADVSGRDLVKFPAIG